MNNSVRAFIAIEVSSEAHKEISRIQAKLRGAGAFVKWVKPSSVHLTLKFLGDTPQEKVEIVSRIMDDIAGGITQFDVKLDNIGVFPSWERPKVVWAGITGEEEISSIAEAIEIVLAEEGFEKENRNFSSHITLGRIKSGKNINKLKSLAESINVIPATVKIDKIILFKSTLTPQGAIHHPLHISPIKG